MSTAPDSGIPEVLAGQLKKLRDRLVGVYVAGGVGLTLFVTCLSIATVMLLDLLIDLPIVLRAVMLFSVPVIAGAFLVRSIIIPLLRTYQDVDLAAIVEETHPELRERLLSLVELEQSRAQGEAVGSDLMREMLVRQTLQFAKSNDFADVVVARRSQRRCWMGAIGLFALLLPLVFATNSYAVLISRFLNPWGNHERLQNLILTVDNAERIVGRGDDVTLIARPSWRFQEAELPEAVWIDWSNSQGVQQSRRVDWNEAEGAYAITIPRVEESFDYSVTSDQSRSRRYHIEVVDRPELKQFAANIVPPQYAGLPPVRMEMVLGDITAVEQSRMTLQLTFSKKIAAAELEWIDEASAEPHGDGPAAPRKTQQRHSLELSNDGTSAALEMTAALDGPSGRFLIRIEDENGLNAREETLCRLTIIPDRPPLIEFADLEQHAAARPTDLLKIPLRSTDDFGVAGLELHYDLVRNGAKETGVLPVDPAILGAKQVASTLDLDLSQLDLKPGMQVILRGRAIDERPVPGPNESWTGIRMLQIQEDARPYGEQTLADQQHRVDQAMDHLKQGLEKQRQEARRLQEQAQRNEAKHEEWRSDAQAESLEENVRELGQQLEKLSAVLETQPIMQPLAEQAQLLAEKELAQAAARVDQAQKGDLAEKQQKFSDAAERLQKAQEQLNKLQQQHHQLAQMQRDMLELNRLALNTEQLAVQVDSLTQRRTGPDGKPLPEGHPLVELWNQDHERLVQRHEQLDQDLTRIINEHPELLEKARENLQHQLAVLGDSADQLSRQQRALAKAVERSAADAKNNKKEAAEPKNPEPPSGEKKLNSEALVAAQQSLALQTRTLGEMTRKLGLPTSEINKMSGELPNVTRATAQELDELNFKRAAVLAREAAEKAAQFQESLVARQDGTVPERLQQQAKEVRQQQSALADELQTLAESKELQSAFRAERQKQMQEQISELVQQLGTRADQLGLKQIDRNEQGEKARLGEEQALQAQQAASAAMDREQAEEFAEATEMYHQAVESLRQAATHSREASAGGNPRQTPKEAAQGEAGQQVAESARNLQIAGEQLAGLGAPSQSSFSESTSQESGKANSQENQEGASQQRDGEGQPDGSKSGQGQGNQMAEEASGEQGPSSSSASQSLRDAARNMRLAAEQMGIGSKAQRTDGPTAPDGRPLDEFSGATPSDSAGTTSPHLDLLNHQLGNVSRRDWGKLPGHLQTEMIESSQRQRDAAYETRIRRYFEEIYRSHPAALERSNPASATP